jgi:hypothetical protein
MTKKRKIDRPARKGMAEENRRMERELIRAKKTGIKPSANIIDRLIPEPFDHYLRYQQMLVRLHILIALGQGDSEDAIVLRQEMEIPEKYLSDQEIDTLNALSGDLYLIHDLVNDKAKQVAETNYRAKRNAFAVMQSQIVANDEIRAKEDISFFDRIKEGLEDSIAHSQDKLALMTTILGDPDNPNPKPKKMKISEAIAICKRKKRKS